jgi:5'(3')-deoxyribonucleotidase
MNRLVIAVDIDGIFANFIRSGLDVAYHLFGIRDKGHDDIDSYRMEESLGLTPEQCKAFFDVMRQRGYCLNIQPYDDARKCIDQLRELGEVHPVTAPFRGMPHWIHERTEWLIDELGFAFEDIVHTKAKHLIKADVLVEDTTATLVKWCQHHPNGLGIRVERAYNCNESWHSSKAETLLEIPKIIDAFLDDVGFGR